MKKAIYLLAFILMFITTTVFADNLKIGIIDMNQVLQKSTYMKSLNDDLAKKFKPRQDEITKATAQLQDEANQLDAATGMSPADRSKLQNKILTDKANVQILTANFQKDLAIEKDKLQQSFMSKLSGVISKIANDQKYDIIEQQTNMLYINPNLDITSQVLKQM